MRVLKSFKARVQIRWWATTFLSLGIFVASYVLMETAIQPLLGATESNPYNMSTSILAALWYCRIWFAIAILLDKFLTNMYIHNSDTELWQMEEIEITKRISAYDAELARRKIIKGEK